MNSILSSSLAALSAAGWCLYYRKRIGVRSDELLSLMRKCANLGACYSAFSPSRFSVVGAYRLGVAAFLCAAYDFATDWSAFDGDAFERFRQVLYERVPKELGDIAVRLYADEVAGKVGNDGLDRGVAALEFLTKVGGSHRRFLELGIERLGTLCQIIDDVLDVTSDAERGELNCLLTVNRDRHLHAFLAEERFLYEIFADHRAMRAVISAAQREARALIAASNATNESATIRVPPTVLAHKFEYVPGDPH